MWDGFFASHRGHVRKGSHGCYPPFGPDRQQARGVEGLLLLLLLLLLLSLLRLREANTILEERILKLDENKKWWENRCKWFQWEYDRRHAALRTGDCHMRVKGDGR